VDRLLAHADEASLLVPALRAVLAWPVLAWPVLAWPVLAWPVLAWLVLAWLAIICPS